MDVFVARQAIFDRQRGLYAYELLFRSDSGRNEFDGTEATAATTQVIANSVFAIGLDTLLGGKKAFLNLGRDLLLDGWRPILPCEIAVIEVLETVAPDPEVLAACRKLRAEGYSIALDDFVCDPRFEALTEIANIIKVDMRTTSMPEQERLLGLFKDRGILMLAEKVETYEEFQWARNAGYDYFQGYFFARPVIVRGRQIPASTVTCLRLLQEAQYPELNFERLSVLISEDVSLSYKLLRYVNSPIFQRARPINSIREAVIRVGEAGMRRWIILAALPWMSEDKPSELATLSIVRARFCECVAKLANFREHETAFLIGLFSMLDALVGRPLDQALSEVKLAPEIADVLLGVSPETDRFTVLYKLARRYEIGEWDDVEALGAQLGVPAHDIGNAYLDSIRWASELFLEAAC